MPTKLKPLAEAPRPINAGVRIGHVHLKVADLDRALGFYTGVLGFELMQRYGQQAAFVSAGGYHHHIGLNTWESRGGQPPAPGTTGLYHVAIVYPTRADLAEALQRLIDGRHLARRRQRSRRERGALPARPRRQRRRALLGPPRSAVAAQSRRHPRHEDGTAEPRGAAGGGEGGVTVTAAWVERQAKPQTGCAVLMVRRSDLCSQPCLHKRRPPRSRRPVRVVRKHLLVLRQRPRIASLRSPGDLARIAP